MSLSLARAGASPGLRVSRALERPELVPLAALALAWPAFVLMHAAPGVAAGAHVPDALSAAFAALPAWTVMTLAMMLPLALPAARHVGLNSLRRRRHRAVATFLLAYVAVWAACGLVAIAVLAAARAAAPAQQRDVLLPVALGLAAAWQLSPWKRAALASCGRATVLPPSGWRATAACLRFGVAFGTRCVRSCWAPMLVMAAAGGGHVAWTLAIGGLLLGERYVTAVRRHAAVPAAALALLAVVAVALPPPAASAASLWFCPIPR